MSKKNNRGWNRCEACGKFISMADLDSGKAASHWHGPDIWDHDGEGVVYFLCPNCEERRIHDNQTA